MSPKQSSIGRYEVTEEIGRGSMGIVHRAHDPVMGRDVAIKTVLVPNGLSETKQQEFHERFLREAQAAGRLSHPGIVTVYDFNDGPDDELPFIAMEYVPGPTLHELIDSEGALNPEWALDVVETLADALQSAHAAGIVHRDLKPANVLVRESDGSAKIVDFGVARVNLSELTRPGTTYGSPSYMAPERIKGKPADARSDLFSLAVILYEALSAMRPFHGNDFAATCYAILNQEPVPIRSFEPGLSPAFDSFFARALAKDPDERFQDGNSFRDALRAVRQDQKMFSGGAATMVVSVSSDADEVAVEPPIPFPQAKTVGGCTAESAEPRDKPRAAPRVAEPPKSAAGVQAVLTPAWALARECVAVGQRVWADVRQRVPPLWLGVGGVALLLILLSFAAGWGLRGTPDAGQTGRPVPPTGAPPVEAVPPQPTAPVNVPAEVTAPPTLDLAPAAEAAAGDAVRQEPTEPPVGQAAAARERSSDRTPPAAVEPNAPKPADAKPQGRAAAVEPKPEPAEATPATPEPAEAAPATPEQAAPTPTEVVGQGGIEAPPLTEAVIAQEQQPGPVAAGEVAYVRVNVKNSFKEATLSLLLDGEPLYSAELASESSKWNRAFKKATMQADQTLQQRLEIPAGEHTLEARVVNTVKSREYEEIVRIRLRPGELRTLRIVIGSSFGRKLTLKLD